MDDSLGVRIIIWSVQKPGVFKQIGIVHSDVISSASLATAPDAQTEQKESQHNSDGNEGCQETFVYNGPDALLFGCFSTRLVDIIRNNIRSRFDEVIQRALLRTLW